MARPQRKLVAVLAADVAGYSRSMGVDKTGAHYHLKALRAEVIDPKVAQFKGRLVGTAGDSLLIDFPSAVDALQFAVETQERITARAIQIFLKTRRMAFRMGVNAGEVILESNTPARTLPPRARTNKISVLGGEPPSPAIHTLPSFAKTNGNKFMLRF